MRHVLLCAACFFAGEAAAGSPLAGRLRDFDATVVPADSALGKALPGMLAASLKARQGCYVLVPDQLGHGERRQHPFNDKTKYAGEFKVGRQDYYFRYNTSLQLYLIGDSLMGWMAWDTMRGVDLLLSKPGIDAKRI